MPKISQHDMLVTIATMALLDDEFTAHDVIEALRALGHGDVVAEARAIVPKPKKSSRKKIG